MPCHLDLFRPSLPPCHLHLFRCLDQCRSWRLPGTLPSGLVSALAPAGHLAIWICFGSPRQLAIWICFICLGHLAIWTCFTPLGHLAKPGAVSALLGALLCGVGSSVLGPGQLHVINHACVFLSEAGLLRFSVGWFFSLVSDLPRCPSGPVPGPWTFTRHIIAAAHVRRKIGSGIATTA